jgi:hypothetical protein
MNEIEIFVMTNADGDSVSSHDADLLEELWQEHIGDVPTVSQVYRLLLEVPTPAPIEVRGKLPAPTTPLLAQLTAAVAHETAKAAS